MKKMLNFKLSITTVVLILFVASCHNSSEILISPAELDESNDYSISSIPPLTASWLDWFGDIETGECISGPRRVCIEVVFMDSYFDELNRAIVEDDVAEYLNSDIGKEKFPYEEEYVQGLMKKSMYKAC